MKWYEWIILIFLMVIVSTIVHEFRIPYIGEIQFNRNDLPCSGCIEAHLYDKVGDTDYFSTIVVKPDSYSQQGYENSNKTYEDCFVPEYDGCKEEK